MKLIDKNKLLEEIEKLKQNLSASPIVVVEDIESLVESLEVKEVSEELAETYMQVFEKKFPILPTLKGKQLDKFKNFLNRCQQIFGLQEFGIRPVQAKLFEKLALLWAAWGAKNLQEIGQMEGEPDIVKEVDLEKEWKEYFKYRGDVATVNLKHLAKHFYELGLKAQKGD